MPVICTKIIGEFPNIGCLIVEGITNSISKKETFLGGRRSDVVNRKVNVILFLQTDHEMDLFTEWWTTALDYGVLPFKIHLSFMGRVQEYVAVMTNDLVENPMDDEIREIKLELLLQT